MTLLTPHDSRAVCRILLTGKGRWVSLSLSLGELTSTTRFLVISERLLYEMAGVDGVARTYGLPNWQGGIISGARYAFRALKAPLQQVCLHELRGQLGSEDIPAVSHAAAVAVARLLARPGDIPLDIGGWKMEEELLELPSAGASPGAKVVHSQPEPRQEPAENRSPLSGPPDNAQDTPDRPADPGVPADQAHG